MVVFCWDLWSSIYILHPYVHFFSNILGKLQFGDLNNELSNHWNQRGFYHIFSSLLAIKCLKIDCVGNSNLHDKVNDSIRALIRKAFSDACFILHSSARSTSYQYLFYNCVLTLPYLNYYWGDILLHCNCIHIFSKVDLLLLLSCFEII